MKHKIVITDAIFLTDEHIETLHTLGDINIYDNIASTDEELIERINDATIIITGFTEIRESVIAKAKKLQMISIWATGHDFVDVAFANSQNIVVTNVPNYALNSVAEYTIGSLLMFERHLKDAVESVKKYKFDWKPFQGYEINTKTLGIIGFGNIGSKLASIAYNGFNMNIISYTLNPKKKDVDYVDFVSLEELLKRSDYISINIPLNEETENMIDIKEFNQMKKTVVIINTSRGNIINESLLYDMLKENKIRGAILDVVSLNIDNLEKNSLLKLDNVIITPHIAFHTKEALIVKTSTVVSNIKSFLNEKSINVITI